MSRPSKAVMEAADKIYDMAYDDNQSFDAENIESVIEEAIKPEREAANQLLDIVKGKNDEGRYDWAIEAYKTVRGEK